MAPASVLVHTWLTLGHWILQIPENEVEELIQHLDGAQRGVIDYNGEPKSRANWWF